MGPGRTTVSRGGEVESKTRTGASEFGTDARMAGSNPGSFRRFCDGTRTCRGTRECGRTVGKTRPTRGGHQRVSKCPSLGTQFGTGPSLLGLSDTAAAKRPPGCKSQRGRYARSFSYRQPLTCGLVYPVNSTV